MYRGKISEFDLAGRLSAVEPPSALPVASAIALALLTQIRELATWAEPGELDYIAWRAGQLTNDLVYAAARAAERAALSDAA
jgi:hypothetical protein